MDPAQTDPSGSTDGSKRLARLLAAGRRALEVEGDLAASRESFEAAVREADARDDAEALGEAVLGLGGMWLYEHRSAVDAARLRAWRAKALAGIDPATALAIRLRLRDAAETDYPTGATDRVLASLDEARRLGDPVILAESLNLTAHCLLGPQHAALRLALARELLAVAALSGRDSDATAGLMWRVIGLFLAGHPHADRALGELRAAVESHGHLAIAYVTTAIEVMTLIRSARFAEAERLAEVCAERGAAAGDPDVPAWRAAHVSTIRWFQGRADELVPMLADVVSSPTLSEPNDSFYAALAVAAATAGNTWEASGALRRLRRPGLADLPRSSVWLVSIFGAVEAARLLEDIETAAEAYELLLPFVGLPVMASLAVTCLGSAHHPAGVAALTLGDVDRAVGHFRQALAADEALGHRPAHLLSQAALAAALAQRNQPGDADEAAALRPAVEHNATELGMGAWLARWRFEGPDAPPSFVDVSCLREGREWRLTADARTIRVRDGVGIRYLATLIANPGQEIPAAELVRAGAAADLTPASPMHALLDESAMAAYRQRLTDLSTDLDDAEANADIERAAGLRAEYDWLISELEHATGLGGRARLFPTDTERARTAVRKAIKRALVDIGHHDARLGRALEGSIVTGSRCSYQPALRRS